MAIRLFEDAIYKLDNPIWRYHPGLFRAAVMEKKWSVDFCSELLGRLFSGMRTRRTMQTVMRLPDGTERSLGQSLKPCIVETIEVSLDNYAKRVLSEQYNELAMKTVLGADPDARTAITTIGDLLVPSARSNPAAIRRLTLSATDLRFEMLTKPQHRTVMQLSGRTERLNLGDELARRFFHVDSPEAARIKAVNKKERTEAGPAGGVEEVNRLILARDGGYTWYFTSTRHNSAYSPPTNRIDALK